MFDSSPLIKAPAELRLLALVLAAHYLAGVLVLQREHAILGEFIAALLDSDSLVHDRVDAISGR